MAPIETSPGRQDGSGPLPPADLPEAVPDQLPPSEVTAQVPRHRRSPTGSGRWLIAEVAVIGALMWLITRNSFFYTDDLLYLQMGELDDLSLAYLQRANFGHFAPYSRLAYWVVQRAFPLDFAAARILTVGAFVGSVACMAFLIRRLAGWGPAAWAAVAWWGVSVFGVRVMLWWAASTHIYSALVFTLLSLLFFVRWHQEGRRFDYWLSVAGFVAALLVQERPILIPLYLVLLRYIVLAPPPKISLSALWGQVRRDLTIWIPYAIVTIAAVANLLWFYAENAGRPSAGAVLTFLRLSLTDGFLPGLVGGSWGQVQLSDAGWHPSFGLSQALGGVAVVTVVGLSLTRQRAGRAWLFAGIVYLANMVLLAAGRANVFVPRDRAVDLQYYVEVHLFFCLAIAITFAAPRRGKVRWPAGVVERVALPALAVVLVIGVALGARDVVRITTNPRTTHAYVDNIHAGFREFGRMGSPVEVLPLRAPPEIAPWFIVPYDDHVTFLRLFPDRPRRDVDSPAKYVVDQSGRVRPVLPYLHSAVTNPQGFNVSGSFAAAPVDQQGRRCFVPASSDAAIHLAFPERVSTGALFVGLDYESDGEQVVRTVNDVDTGELKFSSWAQVLPAGRHVAYLRLESGVSQGVHILDFATNSRFCLSRVDLVSLVFADRRHPDGRCPEVGATGDEREALPCSDRFGSPNSLR